MANRVLIVDDQREVSRLLKSALETIEQGRLLALEAPSGEEAILEASRGKVDLLIADFRLPGITGIELIKKFRARNPDVKVIMITGVTDPRQRQEVASCGADAYFFKPVPMSDFLAAVERLLGLTQTVFPSSAPPAPKEPVREETRKTLGDVIATLRQTLSAKSVTIFDPLGHVQAGAGDLPDPEKSASLISALMTARSASQKVALTLGRADGHTQLFSAGEVDGVLLPLGAGHSLFVTGKDLALLDKLPKTLETLRASRDEMLEMLVKMGVSEDVIEPAPEASVPVSLASTVTNTASTASVPAMPPASEEIAEDFLALLSQAAPTPAKATDFWDTLVEKGTTYAEPDKLTFEQASRLGLTPEGGK